MTQSLTPNEQADCYCSCHQLTSSRPSCEHCRPNQTTPSKADSELRAAIDEVPLEVTLRGITTHLVPEDPGNPELESKRDSTMVEIMELLNNALTAERTAIKARLPKPSGRNTEFDRGYDKALQHVISDIEATE